MRISTALPILALVGLAACGSTDDGASFNDLLLEGGLILDEYRGADPTPLDQMPLTGSATYTGVAAYSTTVSDPGAIADNPEALSHIAMTADFATADISGRLYDFQVASGDDINGELAITNGTITGNAFDADVSGVLDEAGTNVTYDGDMFGAFVDDGAVAMTGVMEMDTTAGGKDAGTVNGAFAAEQ